SKNKFRNGAIILTLAGVALGSGMLLGRPQSRQEPNPIKSKLDRDSVPVVDYSINRAETLSRQAKNKRYNGHNGFVEAEFHGEDAVVVNDWDMYLPALPVAQSDLVVTGRVGRASAHL